MVASSAPTRTRTTRRVSTGVLLLMVVAVLGVAFLCFVPGVNGEGVPNADAPKADDAFVVVGYLPEWRFGGTDWDATCASLTHLLLFSMEVAKDAKLTATDRFPSPEAMVTLREAAAKHGTKLLLSLGGNARTNGFPVVAVDKKLRRKLVRNLAYFCEIHGLHGVDYNWEYPANREEWEGLFALLKATKKEFGKRGLTVTMAYYPDGRQERILAQAGVERHVDFVHSMAYDQPGRHSTDELAATTLKNAKEAGLPYPAVTLGLPFYGRHTRTGDWKTYEDLAKEHPEVGVSGGGDEVAGYFFNGPDTIRRKVRMAKSSGVGGVMIWEVGQDFHPDDKRSLLQNIAQEVWPGGRRPKQVGGDDNGEKKKAEL